MFSELQGSATPKAVMIWIGIKGHSVDKCNLNHSTDGHEADMPDKNE